jgi:putative sigma-54 modulation protein
MQVSLSGHQVGRLDRHFDQALDIHIVLTVEKLRHKAEATLHVSGSNLHADDVREDMYAAIDGLIDKLDRQGKRHKEKLKSHRPKNTPAELA